MIVDRLIPDKFKADAQQLFKARYLMVFSLVVSFGAIVAILSAVFIEQNISPRRLGTLLIVLGQIIPVWLLNRYKSLNSAAWSSIGLCFLLIEYSSINNLTLAGPITIYFIVPPIMAAFMIGARATIYMAILTMLVLFANYGLLVNDLLPEPVVRPENLNKISLISALITVLIMSFLVSGLVKVTRHKEMALSEEALKRQQLLQDLFEAKNAAEESAKSKSMFLATMSHELRTPLNGVIGNASLLHGEALAPDLKARVDDIQLAANLLLTLINDILDFSKLDTKGVELHPSVFNLSEQLCQLHQMYLSNVAEGVAFKLNLNDPELFVEADKSRVAQVVMNFVSNAVKFTHSGHIELGQYFNDDHHLVLYVQDTGKGISKDDQDKLFGDFVQVGQNQNLQKDGTGLGLAIVKRIVIAMHGKVNVESALGEGTTISVTLPIRRVDAPQPVIEQDEDSLADEAKLFSSLNVLVVDDVKMNCIVLEALLREISILQVKSVDSGQEAIDYVAKHPETDFVLLDVRMPDIDGLEACRQMRASGYQNKIVAVTANAFVEDREECLAAGMDGFVSKPIDLSILKKELKRLL